MKHLQFIIYGLFAPLRMKKSNDIAELPNEILTIKGILVLIIIIIFTIIEYTVLLLWAKRKGWRKKVQLSNKSILDNYDQKIQSWFDKKGFIKYNPNFYEEYLFYKYYKKILNIPHIKEEFNHNPENINEVFEESKKNYLSAKLSGIK